MRKDSEMFNDKKRLLPALWVGLLMLFILCMATSCQPSHTYPGVYPAPAPAPVVQHVDSGSGFGSSLAGSLIGSTAGTMLGNHLSKDKTPAPTTTAPAQRYAPPVVASQRPAPYMSPQRSTVTVMTRPGGGTRTTVSRRR